MSDPANPLACPVRGCGLPLAAGEQRFACAAGHGFDRARSGYVNLLQPQDRRSKTPGDRLESTAARERLLGAGVGAAMFAGVLERATAIAQAAASTPASVLEVGAGHGALTSTLAQALGARGWCAGIDLSVEAVERAAKRRSLALFIVANADRRLPVRDGALDLLISIAGPKAPEEFARVLAPGGVLLLGVPAPDDLVELRAAVQGEGRLEDRGAAARALFEGRFDFERSERHAERHRLDRAAIGDLLSASYRGARHSAGERVDALEHLDITVALDLLEFRRRAV